MANKPLNRGFDTTASCIPHIQAIKAAGYSFVARYYSHSTWKNLTREEAVALSNAGIYVVAVWESAGDHAAFFTHMQGIQDGIDARRFALRIGQPCDSPVYVAVDADLPVAGGVTEYFRGVREAFKGGGRQIGVDAPFVGVYGSGAVCKGLAAIGYVSHTWLAQPLGWDGSMTYHDWNLRQGPTTTFANMDVDLDEAAPKGGGGFLVK